MNQISHTIQLVLQELNKQNSGKEQGVQNGNKHIFQACIEKLGSSLNFEEKMTLLDHHNCYGKALDAARQNNLGQSNRWLEKADELPNFDRKDLRHVVAVNKIPALAYHYYKEKNYSQAIELLEQSITISGQLAKESNIDYMIWGQMENYINIFRVHCTKGNETVAIKYAQAILLALVDGTMTADTIEHVNGDILRQAEIDFLSYATDDILDRLRRFKKLSEKEIILKVFKPLSNSNWKNCPLPGYASSIQALLAWASGDSQFLSLVEESLPLLSKQANSLQFYLLEAITEQLAFVTDSNLQTDYANSLLDYYRSYLGISPEQIAQYSQLEVQVIYT